MFPSELHDTSSTTSRRSDKCTFLKLLHAIRMWQHGSKSSSQHECEALDFQKVERRELRICPLRKYCITEVEHFLMLRPVDQFIIWSWIYTGKDLAHANKIDAVNPLSAEKRQPISSVDSGASHAGFMMQDHWFTDLPYLRGTQLLLGRRNSSRNTGIQYSPLYNHQYMLLRFLSPTEPEILSYDAFHSNDHVLRLHRRRSGNTSWINLTSDGHSDCSALDPMPTCSILFKHLWDGTNVTEVIQCCWWSC